MENEKNKNFDMAIITVCGHKKRFEKTVRGTGENTKTKGLLYVSVDTTFGGNKETQTFRFDIWDEDMMKRVEDIPKNAKIRVTAKPSNYNYERDGEKFHSYDLTVLSVNPYSGKECAEFSFRGRLVADAELGTQPGKPYLTFRLASNVGKPVYIHMRHYNYGTGFQSFGLKGMAVSAEGYVKRNLDDNTYSFFATGVWSNEPNCLFVPEPIFLVEE